MRLVEHQRVLYETAFPGDAPPSPEPSLLVRDLMQQLELDSYQFDAIDHTPPHFVYADVTLEELLRIGPWRTIVVGEPRDDMLLRALKSGSRGRELKIVLARALALRNQAADQGDDVARLTATNEIAIDTLRRHFERGDRDVALFYGAAHGRDLERRLFELGFEREGEPEYLDAWSIGASPDAR